MRAMAPTTAGPSTTTGPAPITEVEAVGMRAVPQPQRVLVIGCGALVRELGEIAARNGGEHLAVQCLPAKLHNRPEQIAPAVRRRVRAAKASGAFRTILVGYMDCGTGGGLDRVCAEEGVERLPGAHCYELYAGAGTFAGLQEAELGTFYLTDYLVRHFDRLVMRGLGISEHPELLEMYFGNYIRVVHLAQTDDPGRARAAEHAAARLGLRCERIVTGIGGLERPVVELSRRAHRPEPPAGPPAPQTGPPRSRKVAAVAA